MRRLLLILSLLALCAGPAAQAQVAVRADSSAFHARQLIAPGVLLGAGFGIHYLGHEAIDIPVNRWVQEQWRAGGPERTFDDVIQYLPLAMDLGLGLAGVPAEHGFLDRAIETSMGLVALAAVSWTVRDIVRSPRPNGANNQSLPSGHSGLVFFGAEMVRLEYGWGWGAGAYAVATTVAVMRNYNNWHWVSDVLAGAGLGILVADASNWLLEPTKRLLGIRTSDWGSGRRPVVTAAVSPTLDPVSGAVCTTLALRF